MSDIRYPVRIVFEETGFVADFPDLGGLTDGKTFDETLLNAGRLLETLISYKIKRDEGIAHPTALKKGEYEISVPPLMAAKLLLYWEMRSKRMKKSALARRLSCHLPYVEKLLDVKHESNLSQINRAFAVMGKRILISVEDLPPEQQLTQPFYGG
ncbi:MAG: type II toxin-antitoxin system HicB family antitoxin [Alphaproteobacteria bacterium]|nr:type II toxin-antitoxin system HicB family antitoxin [Alphaproteobacteria bacterium]